MESQGPSDVELVRSVHGTVPQSPKSDLLHPLQQWAIISGMMLGIYLTGLDTTMLSTITPSITDYFGTINDISWYETAYVLAACAFIPLLGRIYGIFSSKGVYICFMVIFELGSVTCAVSSSSSMLVAGRAINGVGSAGQLTGALLLIWRVCEPKMRPIITSVALSLISVGSITGPLIAGALADKAGWRWCFWIFLPLGGIVVLATLMISVPEETTKPPLRKALCSMHKKLDPIGFVIFAGATTTFLLAITWGGSKFDWSSATIVGLVLGSAGLIVAFTFWIKRAGNDALIPLLCLCRPSVAVGSLIMFLQAGTTQMIPYFLPLWFQAIHWDSPVSSAVHMLSSLVAQIIGLIAFGVLVQTFRYVPPWAILGSALSGIGSGLLTRLSFTSSSWEWIGYQIITSIGRGMAFQAPIVIVQQDTIADKSAISLAVLNLSMSLGLAVGVSAGQTIFRSQLSSFLTQYVPGVDPNAVLDAGATSIVGLGSPDQALLLNTTYNMAITRIFYIPAASSALAFMGSFGMSWRRLNLEERKNKSQLF
ncbi:MFS general substrate transporter [Thozetella sp. PMI_491]|nr:MFS general substrate transporter [Thozetella sp. PMI_491]